MRARHERPGGRGPQRARGRDAIVHGAGAGGRPRGGVRRAHRRLRPRRHPVRHPDGRAPLPVRWRPLRALRRRPRRGLHPDPGDAGRSGRAAPSPPSPSAPSPATPPSATCRWSALQADVQRFLRRGFHLPRLSFPPGATIVREGDSGDEAYIVVRGTCVASKTVGGERRVLRHMGPGEVFGEMGMLSSLPRSATVEAVSPVTVLVVKKSDLDDEVGSTAGSARSCGRSWRASATTMRACTRATDARRHASSRVLTRPFVVSPRGTTYHRPCPAPRRRGRGPASRHS